MSDRYMTFTSDGMSIRCMSGSDAKIISLSGIGSVETEHSTISNPYLPGEQTNHIHDKQRFINAEIVVPKSQRSFYLHFFRVNSVGTINIKYGDVERYIEYIVSASTVDQATVCEDPILSLTFRCAYPYWKDVDGFGENLGEKIPLLSPEFGWLAGAPLTAAYTKFDRRHAVTNTGEMPVGFLMRIQTTETAKNPKIMLMDKPDTFIKVYVDLAVGDILEISTIVENGNMPNSGKDVYITLNGENVLNKTDQFSTFFQIDPGSHVLGYEADEGEQTLQLWFWRNWVWSWV